MLARRLVDSPVSESAGASIGADILASVEWMHHLMQDLLDVASIEAGRLSVETEPAVLYEVAQAAIAMFADRAANLVSNALRFTRAGGRVMIGAAADDANVTVWVRDTGVGIPESDLPHVFDRFWHARRGEEARGHGLGLAIAEGIARAHGGGMRVESVLGQGTTFSFTLHIVRRNRTPTRVFADATSG